MYVVKGTKEVPDMATVLKTIAGEPIQSRLPQVPPSICPRCGASLYEAQPTTMRMALLRQLETHSSSEPTATRQLAVKLLQAPDPLTLENAEVALLKAAIEANGFGFRDCVQALVLDFVKTATRQQEEAAASPEAVSAAEETT